MTYTMRISNPVECRVAQLETEKAATEREISWLETVPQEWELEPGEPQVYFVEYMKDYDVPGVDYRQFDRRNRMVYICVGRIMSNTQVWTFLDQSAQIIARDLQWDNLVTQYLYKPQYATVWWEIRELHPFFEHPAVEQPVQQEG